MVRQGLKKDTIRSRIGPVDLIARYSRLPAPHLIRAEHITRYFDERKIRPSGRRQYLAAVKHYFTYLGEPSPSDEVPRPKRPRYQPRPLDPEVYRQVRDHLAKGDPTVYRWWRLGAELGLRSFETAKVEGAHLDAATRKIYVEGKAGSEYWLKAPRDLFDDLMTLAQDNPGRLWPGVRNFEVSRAVATAAAQIGVRMEYHQCRHTAITMYLRRTNRLDRTQNFARHADPITTMSYALAESADEQEILDSLHQEDRGREKDLKLLALLRESGLDVASMLRKLLSEGAGADEEDDL